MLDSLHRGESPLASHLLWPGILNDADAAERALGIAAGLEWGRVAEATVVYLDHGVSAGMRQGIEHARADGRPVDARVLDNKAGRLQAALDAYNAVWQSWPEITAHNVEECRRAAMTEALDAARTHEQSNNRNNKGT